MFWGLAISWAMLRLWQDKVMFDTSELVFIPFTPLRHSQHILAWRKNIELSLAAQEFIEFVKNNKL